MMGRGKSFKEELRFDRLLMNLYIMVSCSATQYFVVGSSVIWRGGAGRVNVGIRIPWWIQVIRIPGFSLWGHVVGFLPLCSRMSECGDSCGVYKRGSGIEGGKDGEGLGGVEEVSGSSVRKRTGDSVVSSVASVAEGAPELPQR